MSKINIVIDCDPGIDDSLALIMALLSDDLNVVAISICGGNNTVEKGYINAKRILKLLNKDIALVKGYEQPFFRKLEITEETHGKDGFGQIGEKFDLEYNFNPKQINENPTSIEDFYANLIDKYKDLCIVALGPLTNFYGLIRNIPEKISKIHRFISMGGNYKSFGNTSPLAEYNYWVDPEAASFVYNNLPVKVEMVGLDVTRKLLLDNEKINQLIKVNKRLGSFIKEITKFYFDFHREYENIEGCIINDPLVIAYLIDDKILKGFESYTDIACQGIARGISIVDDHNMYKKVSNSIIYTQVDDKRFFELFKDIIGFANEK